jgi:hypothetical protein
VLSTESPCIHREGVLAHQASATNLLFITLRKSEALFSPSTRYRDLALGPSLFHWESGVPPIWWTGLRASQERL